MKANHVDGSTLCLRFATKEAAERAMAIGMAMNRVTDGEHLGVA